VKSEEY
jgi:hypothetical protein